MPSGPYFRSQLTSTLAPHHYCSQGFPPVSTDLWDLILDDLSLNTLQHPTQGPYLAYTNVATTDLTASVLVDSHVSDDLYFPYDPISGEFIYLLPTVGLEEVGE